MHLFTDNPPPDLGAVSQAEPSQTEPNQTRQAVTLHRVGDGVGDGAGDGARGEAQNLGISAFDLRNGQAFVSVVNSAPRPQEVELEVTQGTAPAMRTTLLVPREGQANAAFPVAASSPADVTDFYRAHINVPPSDALSLDDDAYVSSRALRAVVSPPSPPVERALGRGAGAGVARRRRALARQRRRGGVDERLSGGLCCGGNGRFSNRGLGDGALPRVRAAEPGRRDRDY